MNPNATLILSTLVLFCTTPAHAVTFDWATIGNTGNAPDSETGLGAVNYTYRISKHEVRNEQYVDFLNAVAATDNLGLFNTSMESDTRGGIVRLGTQGNYRYEVKSAVAGEGLGGNDYRYETKPVVYISFLDAMRFVNWLENGQPTGLQGPSTTEEGVYTISDGVTETRRDSASYFIPSTDEWYKAAYYDPRGFYYDYPTSSDAQPDNNSPLLDTGNSANYSSAGWPPRDEFVTTGDVDYPLTDVGAYTLSASPYGTYDQAGNVIEWTDTVPNPLDRGLRGSNWAEAARFFKSDFFGRDRPPTESFLHGFRVASIPEPNTLFLAATIFAAITFTRRSK